MVENLRPYRYHKDSLHPLVRQAPLVHDRFVISLLTRKAPRVEVQDKRSSPYRNFK